MSADDTTRMERLFATAAGAAARKAISEYGIPTLLLGEVVDVDVEEGTVDVYIDGAEEANQKEATTAMTVGLPPSDGARCAVLFIPPHGVYAIGAVGAPGAAGSVAAQFYATQEADEILIPGGSPPGVAFADLSPNWTTLDSVSVSLPDGWSTMDCVIVGHGRVETEPDYIDGNTRVSTRLFQRGWMQMGRESKCFWEDGWGGGTHSWPYDLTWTAQVLNATAFTVDIDGTIELAGGYAFVFLKAYNLQIMKIRRS